MTLGALIAIALSFFLALFASWALLLPFFESESPEGARGGDRKRDLVLKRDFMLDALEDLEQDFRSQKITENDYQEAKQELERLGPAKGGGGGQ